MRDCDETGTGAPCLKKETRGEPRRARAKVLSFYLHKIFCASPQWQDPESILLYTRALGQPFRNLSLVDSERTPY